jgi:glycosyltransferase involved in cell wall biosynthesis
MSGRLFIQASNIHQGGGRTLLDALLRVRGAAHETIVLADDRMQVPQDLPGTCLVRRVRPTVVARLGAERWLAANVGADDVVLCLGNLPPMFRLAGRTLVFIQNRYLIENIPLASFPPRVRARIMMERLWLSSRSCNADEFVVQTPTMKRLLEAKVGRRATVRNLPFVAEPGSYARRAGPSPDGQVGDFVYVATGEPHKNHRTLVEAWRLLAEEGHFPSLTLTLSRERFPALCAKIASLTERYGLEVRNVGELPPAGVKALYGEAGAAIYPSAFESFGLPLIEARQAGLPVLAPERDYVRDVVDPEETFDPQSPISIARAVKRFMGIEELPLPLQDAKSFLQHVIGMDG